MLHHMILFYTIIRVHITKLIKRCKVDNSAIPYLFVSNGIKYAILTILLKGFFMVNIKAWLGLSFYTSELDQFLMRFDQTHPKLSKSQHKEKEKYARIHEHRDHETQKQPPTILWDQF